MISLNVIEQIRLYLEDAGIKFQLNENVFITYWGSKKSNRTQILIFPSEDHKWINLVTLIGNLEEMQSDGINARFLLRENSKNIGIKYSVDKNLEIRCGNEIPINHASSEILKDYIIRIVKVIKKIKNNEEEKT